MDVPTSDEECPVCMDKIHNPSQPSACCRKVICQRCLSQALQFRPHCPHCRSPAQSTQNSPLRSSYVHQIMPDDFEIFHSRRPVGSNIQSLFRQLQASRIEQTNPLSQLSPPNQAPPPFVPQNPAPPRSVSSIRRPVPLPRRRRSALAPVLSPAPAPAPTQVLAPPLPPLALNLTSTQDDLQAELDLWPWPTEITFMENQQPQGFSVRTFVCPYCQARGMDELDLRDHCNNNHAYDRRQVVCPVCVATPHGDPQYYSRNFIGHLNQRHCYYMDDFTNLHQSDEMNIQCAILASYKTNI